MRSLARFLPNLVVAGVALVFAQSAIAADVTVSAAASLTNAFGDIARAFEQANPGTHVQLNFGASGALLQQIAKGAPVDVFASADQETMNDAQKQNLIDAPTRVDFARNSLVVIVPIDGRSPPRALADLDRPTVKKVAMGQPDSVPVGRYTKSTLEQANLWSAVGPKMIGASSVRQALDYVARGEVDVGFVYATDAAIMPDRVHVAFAVPTLQPILYPIAVTRDARDRDLAERFVRYVSQPDAQAVLAHYGFAKP